MDETTTEPTTEALAELLPGAPDRSKDNVTPITKASQTGRATTTKSKAKAAGKATSPAKAAGAKTTAKKASASKKAAGATKAPATKKSAPRASTKTQNRLDMVDGMRKAKAVVTENGMKGPDGEKPLQVTRGNWRAIVDGTFDPKNPPAEPVTTGARGNIAALPDKSSKVPDGTIVTQVNRTTRARLHLVDHGKGNKPRWTVHCAAHGKKADTGDRAIANYGMTYAWGWCEGCGEIVGPKVPIRLPYPDNADRALNPLGRPVE